MKCPNCGLTNPMDSQRCDCGYDFKSQTLKSPLRVRSNQQPDVEPGAVLGTALKIFLLIACLLCLAGGALILSEAKSAVHEIEAFILFLIASVFLSTVAVLLALQRLDKR